tara:strand:+ start:82 stop:324 length:243 start_codon:yes stop_codon:yes gene_type:complete
MCECEKFMYATCELVKPAQRVNCMIFKLQFPARHAELLQELSCVEVACDDLRMSLRLKKLLGIILKVSELIGGGVTIFMY